MRVARSAIVIMVIINSARCAGLYHQQQHEAAQSAQKTFAEAKLLESLDEERKQNEEFVVRELQIVERQAMAMRNESLLNILKGTLPDTHKKLVDAVDQRLARLLSGDQDAAKALAVAISDASSFEQEKRWAASEYAAKRIEDDPKLVCTANAPASLSPGATGPWNDFQTKCRELNRRYAAIDGTTATGEVADLSRDIAAIGTTRDKVDAEIDRISAEFRNAEKAAAAARERGQPTDLTAKAKALQLLLANVHVPAQTNFAGAGIGDAQLAAALSWVEVQKASVDRLLEAAANGADFVLPGLNDEVGIARLLPTLANELTGPAVQPPSVAKLAFESERLRIERDRLKRQLSRLDDEVVLLRTRRNLLFQERSLLDIAKADLVLGNAPGDDAKRCTATNIKAETLRDADTPCRRKIAQALLNYVNAWTLYRIPAQKTAWQLIGLEHERVLDGNEVALAQWNGLISPGLEVLVAHFGAGLKADSLGRFLGSAELAWIGLGVH